MARGRSRGTSRGTSRRTPPRAADRGRQARLGKPPERSKFARPLWSAAVLGVVVGFLAVALLTRLGAVDQAAPTPDPEVLARTEPAALPPPKGLGLPDLEASVVVAEPLPPSRADAAAVEQVVNTLVDRRKVLGRRVHVAVAGLDGTPLVSVGSGTFIPASITKLLTATAATDGLARGTRFATTAVLEGRTGPRPLLHLVGGGDPLLASTPDAGPSDLPVADLATLAEQSARNLAAAGVQTVRLRYDSSLFAGDGRNDAWPASYYFGVVAPITALSVDQGRTAGFGDEADPPATAAGVFAGELRAAGLKVRGAPRPSDGLAAAAEAGRTEDVGQVQSAPVDRLVRHMLEVSDNVVAETLAHQLALATGRTPDFAGAAEATEASLRRLGVPLEGLRLRDASGLSRLNRIDSQTVLGVLEAASSAERPELRPVLTDLPVAGFTGSLAGRYLDAPDAGLGTVRAKTGTLTGVHGLAGTVVDRDGTEMLFVAVADRVRVPQTLAARDLLALMTARLAACRCGAAAG